MQVVKFEGIAPDKQRALDVLDDLRKKIESGQVIAFAAVGIEPDDSTLFWTAATLGVSRLRLLGAMAHLQHCYHDGA